MNFGLESRNFIGSSRWPMMILYENDMTWNIGDEIINVININSTTAHNQKRNTKFYEVKGIWIGPFVSRYILAEYWGTAC